MKRILIEGVAIVAMFFLTWFVFQQVNWMSVFRVKEATAKTEEKLGELFWNIYKSNGEENKNKLVDSAIDSIVTNICNSNGIERESIKVHVVNTSEVNAFALPDGHLVIFSGLILASDNQEELCGVICHEMAHIELDHVMKKLAKEVGISTLISMTTGRNGSDIARGTLKILSSTAFDRTLEKEADIKAVDYLLSAHVSPSSFADFLYKLSIQKDESIEYLSWISTHPDSKERAEYIVDYCKDKKVKNVQMLGSSTWNKLITELKMLDR